MRRFIFALLVLSGFFVFPNDSQAISQDKINAEVQIVCKGKLGNYFSGSGTIIDAKGIILTNKHVVTDLDGSTINYCIIGFIRSVEQEPDFGDINNLNIAEVKYWTRTDDMDAAVLYLSNVHKIKYPFINIWGSNSNTLSLGERIEVIGFPGIGGSTITYSSGDFSGFGGAGDSTGNYLKTTAPLEHGNSGGAAYNSAGQFIGIPTFVVAGSLNSISYILGVNSIKAWLSNTLGPNYRQEVPKQKAHFDDAEVSPLENDFTPPDFNKLDQICYRIFSHDSAALGGRCFPKKLGKIEEFDNIQFELFKSGLQSIDRSGLKKIYYYFDQTVHSKLNEHATVFVPTEINSDEVVITNIINIKKEGKYYFTFFGEDNFGNVSNPYVYEYTYEKNHFKKIKDITFYKDRNLKQGLGNYIFRINQTFTNMGWSVDDQLTCKTRLKNIYFKWNYPADLSKKGYLVETNQSSVFRTKPGKLVFTPSFKLEKINLGKKQKDLYYSVKYESGGVSAEGLDQPAIYYNFYLKPVVNSSQGIDIKHKVFSMIYDPKLKKDLVCMSTQDAYDNFLLKNYSSKLNYFDSNNLYNSLR